MVEQQTQTKNVEKQKKKSFFSKIPLFSKMKSIKHIQFIVAGILGLIVIVVFLSSCENSNSIFKSNLSKKTETVQTSNTSLIAEYSKQLETRMQTILSNIKDAGNVSVMIVVDSSPMITYAEHIEEKVTGTGENQIKTTIKYPIIIENGSLQSTVVLVETAPKIKGVLIVAKGASNPKVKLSLISAVQALLNIEAKLIEVIEGE